MRLFFFYSKILLNFETESISVGIMKKIVLLLLVTIYANIMSGQQTDCQHSNGIYYYYAELTINNVPNNFNKTDFINHIIAHDPISNSDLAILNNNIIEVHKSFPSSQTPTLQRVVNVNSNVDISQILAQLNNSIVNIECDPEVQLGIDDNSTQNFTVYPNPVTENSVISFNTPHSDINLEIINSLGQSLFRKQINNGKYFDLKSLKLNKGVYFVKIADINSGKVHILKIVKE